MLGTQRATYKIANIEFENQTQALNVQIQNWNGKLEMVKLQMSKPTPIPPIRMHNSLKEFEKLFKDQTFTCGNFSNTC